MKRARYLKFAIGIAVLLSLAGCTSNKDRENSSPSSLPDADAIKSMYQQAADSINAADALSIYVGTDKSTTIGDQTLSEVSQQQLNFRNYGTDSLQAFVDETIRIGSYTVSIFEAYKDGTGYSTVNGSSFMSEMSAEAYCARFTPATLFDISLYGDIQASSVNECTGITFSQPSAAENWAIPDGAQLLEASGHAVLDGNGELMESIYTVAYTAGTATVTQTTKVVIRSTDDVYVQAPAEADTYTALQHPDAPRQLEIACGYLLQAGQIQSEATENITCQAFAITRTQTTSLSMTGTDDSFSAKLDTNVNQINLSRGGEVTVIQQAELFQNGAYSISTNGGEATENSAVDQETMKTYCQDLLVESILLPEYISDAAITETESTYRITFHASQALAGIICSDICSTLYSDPTLLDTLATTYGTDTLECYLELDQYTGLPVCSGMRFSATHTIEQISYLLTAQTDQTYRYE